MNRVDVTKIVFNELLSYTDLPFSLSTNFKEEILTESLDLVEFSLILEEKFKFEIPSVTIHNWITVEDIINSCLELLPN